MGNQCSSCSLTEDELNEVKVEPKFQGEANGAAEAAKAKTATADTTKKGAAMPSTPLSAKQRDQAADANANASPAAQLPAERSAASSCSPSPEVARQQPQLAPIGEAATRAKADDKTVIFDDEHPSAKATPRIQEDEGPGPQVPPPAAAAEPGPWPPLSAARLASSGPKAPLMAKEEEQDPPDTVMEPTPSATSKPAVTLPRLSLPVAQVSRDEPEQSASAPVTFSPSGQAALGDDDQPLLPSGDFFKAHFESDEMVATVSAPSGPSVSQAVTGIPAVIGTEEDPDAKIVDSVPKNLDTIFACEALPGLAADVCQETSCNDISAPDTQCVESPLKEVADSASAALSETMFSSPQKASAGGTKAWFLRPSVGTWLMTRTPLLQPEERHEGKEADSKISNKADILLYRKLAADIDPSSSCLFDFDPLLEASVLAKDFVDSAVVATEAALTEANVLAAKDFVDSAEVAPEAAVAEANDLLTKAADDTSLEGMLEVSAEEDAHPKLKIVSDFDLEPAQSIMPVVGDFVSSTEDGHAVKGSITGLEDLAINEDSEEFGVVKDAHAGM